jgi:hypothetical protein
MHAEEAPETRGFEFIYFWNGCIEKVEQAAAVEAHGILE